MMEELEGKYRIINQSGQGTFSVVYKGECLADKRIVALKRVSITSSPSRILGEIRFLSNLGGQCNVVRILEALRNEGQSTLVLDYFEHEHFKTYFYKMSLADVQHYMHARFVSLDHLHQQGIIHRDIKPSNFLHSHEKGNGYGLIDFGLAEKEATRTNTDKHGPPAALGRVHKSQNEGKRKRSQNSANIQVASKSIRTLSSASQKIRSKRKDLPCAARAGTRGFRAPEVLTRCLVQTVAIDIWSAGIILLSILSRHYPFFNASEDMVALAEVVKFFGVPEDDDTERITIMENDPDPPLDIEQYCTAGSGCQWPLEAFALLKGCLELSPSRRISAGDVLNHPFFLVDPATATADRSEFPFKVENVNCKRTPVSSKLTPHSHTFSGEDKACPCGARSVRIGWPRNGARVLAVNSS
jgi:cell division control protein 7